MLLMLTRYRCERQAEAVAAYKDLREHLGDELGLEPSPAVEELHLQILDQVPGLDPPSASQGEAELFAWSLDGRLAIPLPRPLERSSSFPLLGRSPETTFIENALDAVTEAGPTVLFVAGEAGIGKTRLVSEVAATIHRNGASVLYGRCVEDLGAPYQPWVEAFEHFAQHAPERSIKRNFERFGDSLSVLVPAMRQNRSPDDADSTHVSPGPSIDDGRRQAMLFSAVVGMLEEAAAAGLTLLVLDDLQWADPSTLQLLRHVATRSASSLLVIGTYRDTDVDDAHALTELIGALGREATTQLITLDGLSEEATIELIDAAAGAKGVGGNREVAAAIRLQTNGNPFFITQFLPFFAEDEARSAVEIETFMRDELPEGIQRVLSHRIARLGEPTARMLRTASVFGREFDVDLLATTLERDELDVIDLIETAIAAGLVTDEATGRDRFSFTHDIIRHFLYDGMIESRRSRTHVQIADSIEGKYADAPGDWVEPIATHLVAAADPDQMRRTLGACQSAGERAAVANAPAEAVLWFDQALALLAAGQEPDEPLRAALLVQLGTQSRNAGDQSHWATLTEAGRLSLSIGEVDTLVESVLANSLRLNARTWEVDDERLELLRAALDALGPVATAERAVLLASLANEQWDLEHRANAESLYRESMALARELGDPTTLATVLIRVSRARNMRLGRDELHAISREVGELAAATDIADPFLQAMCLITVLNTALQLGLADEAAEVMQALWEIERGSELPLHKSAGHHARTLTAGLRGDAVEYERLAGLTFEVLIDADVRDEERAFIFEGQLFYSRYIQGRMNELTDAMESIVRDRPEVPLYRAVSAILYAETRLFEQGSAMVSEEVARGFEPATDMFSIQSLTLWAEAAASTDHLEGCRILLETLAPFSTEMAGHIVQVTEPIDLALGRMCTCLGFYDDAAAHFDIAERIADDFEGAWMRARVDLNRAQMHLARGVNGDREAASRLARRAVDIAEKQGYAAVQRDAELVLKGAA